MPELLLVGIESPATVQEVDGVAVAEQMGVDAALEVCPLGHVLDDLVARCLVM